MHACYVRYSFQNAQRNWLASESYTALDHESGYCNVEHRHCRILSVAICSYATLAPVPGPFVVRRVHPTAPLTSSVHSFYTHHARIAAQPHPTCGRRMLSATLNFSSIRSTQRPRSAVPSAGLGTVRYLVSKRCATNMHMRNNDV